MTALLDKLCKLARRELDLGDGPLKTDLPFLDLGLDSLGLVAFMFAVEDEFHVLIDLELAMQHPTLDGLAALVATLLAAKTATPAEALLA